MTLLQLLKLLNDTDKFQSLFSDLTSEIEELGYEGCEDELVNQILQNHFNITIEDKRQLDSLTAIILDPTKFKAGIETFKLIKRA